jgi:hypothetical protein
MIGLDNRLWHNWQMPNGASSASSPNGIWHVSSPYTWELVGDETAWATISPVRLRDDHSDVYAKRLSDNMLFHSNGDSLQPLVQVTSNGSTFTVNRFVATPYLTSMYWFQTLDNITSLVERRVDSRSAVSFIDPGDQSLSYTTQEDAPIYNPEIWDPATNVWTIGAPMRVPRTYHSSTVLLPDATVLSAGTGPGKEPYRPNAEIYSPPYLFAGTRPVINSAPASITLGTTFSVLTSSNSITDVTLLGLSATTHSHNMGQHFNRLAFTKNGSNLTVTAPANANITQRGYYMLFVLANGVPSVAKMVQVQ